MGFCIFALAMVLNGFIPCSAWATGPSEPVVYGVYRGMSLGNPGELALKDYYISMGSAQGVERGSILRVLRRLSTYDSMNAQLYQDVLFPIAEIKVIHSEKNASIARLQKMLPIEETPAISPYSIMVGDAVQALKR